MRAAVDFIFTHPLPLAATRTRLFPAIARQGYRFLRQNGIRNGAPDIKKSFGKPRGEVNSGDVDAALTGQGLFLTFP
jgi:hypothetical protein